LLLFICIVVALTPLDNRRRRADHHYYLERPGRKKGSYMCAGRAPQELVVFHTRRIKTH
jgi:hypothetical protein